MVITFPLLTVIDDSGVVTTGATVTIASVKDKAGADIASPGATVNLSGANVSVDYDAAAKGEAWIVLAISKVSSTFTGLNAAPAFYLSKDPSVIQSTQAIQIDGSNRAVAVLDPTGLDAVSLATGVNARQGLAAIYLAQSLLGKIISSGAVVSATGLTVTVNLTTNPPSAVANLATGGRQLWIASGADVLGVFKILSASGPTSACILTLDAAPVAAPSAADLAVIL